MLQREGRIASRVPRSFSFFFLLLLINKIHVWIFLKKFENYTCDIQLA